jgi:hypothetical protein
VVHKIVTRNISRQIEANPGWSLLYGRRKVGKTFLIENFVPHDNYFSVRVDRSISARGFAIDGLEDLRTFSRVASELLRNDKTVVIDEFQRLPMFVLEDLASVHPSGRLILTGSSMRVVDRLTGRNSPLLGLLRPFRIGLVSPSDLLLSLREDMTAEEAVSLAPLLRDPWTIPFHRSGSLLEDVVAMLPNIVPGLVGEIFTEDERELTRTYSSILSQIGSGTADHHRIADTLHSRGIIKSGSSSHVIPYMRNMVEMGLLERTRIFRRKKYVYSIPSLPIRMYYYLDSRYGISDRLVSYREVAPAAEGLLRTGIEEFVFDLMAEVVGGRKELLKDPDRELDVLVTVRNRPALVGEVKWGKVTRSDVGKFLAKVENMRCRKVLVSRSTLDTDEVEVLTPDGLMEEASRYSETMLKSR